MRAIALKRQDFNKLQIGFYKLSAKNRQIILEKTEGFVKKSQKNPQMPLLEELSIKK